jgi:predicted transcriptional regulator YheO
MKRSNPVSSAVLDERAAMIKMLQPVVQMLGSVIGPNIEVVLHDLTVPERSIVAIANGHVSNRNIGSSIIAGPKDDKGFHEAKRQLGVRGRDEHSVISDYATVTSGGLKLRSSTVIFRDSLGEPCAALCLNSDLTMFHATHAWLEGYLNAKAKPVRDENPQPAMDLLMKNIIDDAVRVFGKSVGVMNKEEKMQAVETMLQRGLFIVKGGVERAAAALGVSRYTVYNYMEALRQRGDMPESNPSKGRTGSPADARPAVARGGAATQPANKRRTR